MTQFWKQPISRSCLGILPTAILFTFAQMGSAQAAPNLSQCASSSSQKTISCCEKLYAGHKPLWMIESHSNCREAVSCTSSRKTRAKMCAIIPPVKEIKDHETPSSGRQTPSDMRLKTDIHRVGTTVLRLPLYQFEYRNKPGSHYIGVMAQDVLKVKPEAVSIGADGFYRVNYDKLGISMLKVQ